MVRAGKTLIVADIVEINRRMIAHFGGVFFEGDDNLANRGSLKSMARFMDRSYIRTFSKKRA
jgi:hypothetical protein